MKITEPNDIVNLDKTCGEKRIKTIKSKKETNRSQQGGKENNTIGDIVNISSEATKIHQLKSMIEDIPDIRGNRVNAIKENLKNSNGEAVATIYINNT